MSEFKIGQIWRLANGFGLRVDDLSPDAVGFSINAVPGTSFEMMLDDPSLQDLTLVEDVP